MDLAKRSSYNNESKRMNQMQEQNSFVLGFSIWRSKSKRFVWGHYYGIEQNSFLKWAMVPDLHYICGTLRLAAESVNLGTGNESANLVLKSNRIFFWTKCVWMAIAKLKLDNVVKRYRHKDGSGPEQGRVVTHQKCRREEPKYQYWTHACPCHGFPTTGSQRACVRATNRFSWICCRLMTPWSCR